MKKLFLMAGLFVAMQAMANEKKVKSDVTNVTVFTQGAQVYRKANITATSGVTNYVFNGLSKLINPLSIQAGGSGNFTILEVKHNIAYPQPVAKKETKLPQSIIKEISSVEDSITEISFRVAEVADHKSALLLEKDMILKNKLTRGEGKSDSLPILKQAMEYFRVKLTDINAQLATINRTELKHQKLLTQLNERLQDLRTFKNSEEPTITYEPEHQVVVTISADATASGTLTINYMVQGAGWVPLYDLRSTSAGAPMQLTYKANVYQNSGEAWDNVKLKLSTSNPNKGNVKPQLPTWYVDYFNTQAAIFKSPTGARERGRQNSVDDVRVLSKKDNEEMNDLSAAQSSANYAQLIETMTNVEFNINLNYTIPSDGINHLVAIKTDELPAKYYHYLVPKLESEAFLIAKIAGWETLSLLPGTANVFYEGTYVGQTVINPSVISDTLQLALGRDNGIVVTRTKQAAKQNTNFLAGTITKTVGYELKIKSNKSKTINLVIEDQIPVTNNKDIKIELLNATKAQHELNSGLLTWNIDMNPREWQTLKYSYTISFDKNKPLSLN